MKTTALCILLALVPAISQAKEYRTFHFENEEAALNASGNLILVSIPIIFGSIALNRHASAKKMQNGHTHNYTKFRGIALKGGFFGFGLFVTAITIRF